MPKRISLVRPGNGTQWNLNVVSEEGTMGKHESGKSSDDKHPDTGQGGRHGKNSTKGADTSK